MTKIQRKKLFAKLKQKESEFVNIVPKNKRIMIIFFIFYLGFFFHLTITNQLTAGDGEGQL